MCSDKFKLICFLILTGNGFVFSKTVTKLYQSPGELNIGLMVSICFNNSKEIPLHTQSMIHSAVWITQRLNYLDFVPLNFGLTVYGVCNESDKYSVVFDIFQSSNYFLTVITDDNLEENIDKFSEVIHVKAKTTAKLDSYLIKATVQFLSAMDWVDNVSVIAPDGYFLDEFYRYTRRKFICVSDCLIYKNSCPVHLQNTSSGPLVYFGNIEEINSFSHLLTPEILLNYPNIIFIPLDGDVPRNLPSNTFLVTPPHFPLNTAFSKKANILPTPQFFEIATPVLNSLISIQEFILNNCNQTVYKLNCIRKKFMKNIEDHYLSPSRITEILKIEPLEEQFDYYFYKVDNDTGNDTNLWKKNSFQLPYTKVFEYNIFSDNLFVMEDYLEDLNSTNSSSEFCKFQREYCLEHCHNFRKEGFRSNLIFSGGLFKDFFIKTEAWVYAFLSLSLLGTLFCLAILIFIVIRICNKDILEGNPVLTIMLLVATTLLYLSVLPFCINTTKENKENLCLIKSLVVTSTYAITFSLLLSRCVLLATASKEIGFMSHIAGPVQAFLCLFVFGVQAALNLQVLGRCSDIFRGNSFIYLMSYNAVLILLLLCICPLIYKCERNYREGKYFTISIGFVTITWTVWLPLYLFISNNYKEAVICFGLIATASIFIICIFIPRTYLMTIAAAREKISNRLPSLPTASSVLDIYRSNTQPIYDCVNVAAINAITVARAGALPEAPSHQPNFYSCPALADDEDFDFRPDTPVDADKVTRF